MQDIYCNKLLLLLADDFDVEEGSDAGTDEMDEKHLTI